jgi:hypothetical protein
MGGTGLDDGRSRPGLARGQAWIGSHWLIRWPLLCEIWSRLSPSNYYNAIRGRFSLPRSLSHL